MAAARADQRRQRIAIKHHQAVPDEPRQVRQTVVASAHRQHQSSTTSSTVIVTSAADSDYFTLDPNLRPALKLTYERGFESRQSPARTRIVAQEQGLGGN